MTSDGAHRAGSQQRGRLTEQKRAFCNIVLRPKMSQNIPSGSKPNVPNPQSSARWNPKRGGRGFQRLGFDPDGIFWNILRHSKMSQNIVFQFWRIRSILEPVRRVDFAWCVSFKVVSVEGLGQHDLSAATTSRPPHPLCQHDLQVRGRCGVLFCAAGERKILKMGHVFLAFSA